MNFNLSSKCLACIVSIAVVFNSFSSAAFASESTRPKKGKDSPVVSSSSGPLAVTSGNAAHELVRKCKLPGANVEEILFQLCVLFMPNPTLGTERNEDGLTPLDLALTLRCPVEVESLCYAYRYPFDGEHSFKERMEYWGGVRKTLSNIPSECLIRFLNKFDNEEDMACNLILRFDVLRRGLSDQLEYWHDCETLNRLALTNTISFCYYAIFGDIEMVQLLLPTLQSTLSSAYKANISSAKNPHAREITYIDIFTLVCVVLGSLCLLNDVDLTRAFLNAIGEHIDTKNKRWRTAINKCKKEYATILSQSGYEGMKELLITHSVTKDIFKPILRSVRK